MTEDCEGQVIVTDPTHPLFGRTPKLSGLAYLPGHARHCQVEILPGQFAYIPITSTDLAAELQPESTVLTAAAIEELVATFQAWRAGRRGNHATHTQPTRLDAPDETRTRRCYRGDRPGVDGGAGQ